MTVLEWPVVVFDLDGTLVNSEAGIVRCFQQTLAQFDLKAPDTAVAAQIGIPLLEMFAEFGVSDDDMAVALNTYRDLYSSGGLFEGTVYQGATDALAALADKGHRMAVATSKSERYASRVVDHFGFGNWIEVVVGVSADEQLRHKPELIAEALRQLGADGADAVMIGDRDVDILGARAVGAASVGVLWGFGSEAEITKAQPTAVARRWTEVPALVG